ncbi:hypothetical protein TNCV_2481001 [Trichonephila clavipes]|nr:hypothetical protein TNCV_2481001 [Trichonephila clavipes]
MTAMWRLGGLNIVLKERRTSTGSISAESSRSVQQHSPSQVKHPHLRESDASVSSAFYLPQQLEKAANA